ncbi:MAG: hypothetical protein ACR2KM_09855 [Gemmatimonadaceae bacterium]
MIDSRDGEAWRDPAWHPQLAEEIAAARGASGTSGTRRVGRGVARAPGGGADHSDKRGTARAPAREQCLDQRLGQRLGQHLGTKHVTPGLVVSTASVHGAEIDLNATRITYSKAALLLGRASAIRGRVAGLGGRSS